jgi:hypothetical protein
MSFTSNAAGEGQFLNDILTNSTAGNFKLKLFTNNYTPTNADTPASFTEATFTGYAAITLTRSVSGSTWTINSSSSPAVASYPAQSFNATSAQTVYGYYITNAAGTIVYGADKFSSAISLTNPSTLNFTPQITMQ